MQSNFSCSLTKTQENMKQWNLCIIINLLFYTAIIQYMSQLLERQHFTAKMSRFRRYWHLCNENSAYATIASYAPGTRQGAIKLRRGSNNGTGSSLCKPYILIVKSVLIKTEDISYHHFNNAPLFNKVFWIFEHHDVAVTNEWVNLNKSAFDIWF